MDMQDSISLSNDCLCLYIFNCFCPIISVEIEAMGVGDNEIVLTMKTFESKVWRFH